MEKQKTVFAQITPPGISAVASLRISGPGTVPLLNKIAGLEPEHRKVYVSKLRYNGHVLDRAVIVFFQNPHSYTGEDMAEISVHGGIASIRRLKNTLLQLGIYRAGPGEFTKRAFLNSKMDLIQAESIMSITNARTVEELDRAVEVSEGRLSRSISKIRDDIIYIKSYLDGSIDFPDDIEYHPGYIIELFKKIRKDITDIYDGSRNGLLMSDGVEILITGLSNTGKSTLFNRLIREDRAIITDSPGTTRDLLSEWIKIGPLPARITDSAGIRDTEEEVERIGMDKVKSRYGLSDIIIFVYDASRGFTEADSALYNDISHYNHIVIGNKSDIAVNHPVHDRALLLSALKDSDISTMVNDALLAALDFNRDTVSYIMNRREADIMRIMAGIIDRIDRNNIDNNPEIVALEMDELIKLTSEMTGEITQDNILDSIFSNFCIGK